MKAPVLNPLLTGIATRYMAALPLVGTRIAPIFNTPLQSSQYYIYDPANLTDIPTDIRRGASAPFKRLTSKLSSDTFSAQDYGIEESGNWADYDLGRVNTAKYTPKTKERTREWAAATGGYKERTDVVVIEDAFELTMIDFAEKLFDQLMFGMAAAPAEDTPAQAFESATRYKDGWIYIHRLNEDGSTFCKLQIHARLTGEQAKALALAREETVKRIHHPDYGDDSPFYRALGFVPQSENRGGRPRKPRGVGMGRD